jgi:hypothetical protein
MLPAFPAAPAADQTAASSTCSPRWTTPPARCLPNARSTVPRVRCPPFSPAGRAGPCGSRWAWVKDLRWPAQASTRYRRRSPATYTPRQAGGAGQCAGWPWAPAALTKRKHRPQPGGTPRRNGTRSWGLRRSLPGLGDRCGDVGAGGLDHNRGLDAAARIAGLPALPPRGRSTARLHTPLARWAGPSGPAQFRLR